MISDKNLPGQLKAVGIKITRKLAKIGDLNRALEQDRYPGTLADAERYSSLLHLELYALQGEYNEILERMKKIPGQKYFTNCENPSKKRLVVLRPEEATRLGIKAFHDGKRRVPLYDNDLVLMLDLNNQPGESDNLELLSAWNKGWDKANLSQPMPNPDDIDQDYISSVSKVCPKCGGNFRALNYTPLIRQCDECKYEHVWKENPAYRLPKTKPGTIEDLMESRKIVETVTRSPYRVDKEMKMSINPEAFNQHAPDPRTMKDVIKRLKSPKPQNFSLKRVVEGQEARSIPEAIAMDLYGGIPLLGDSNDLTRTTRIIKTSGSPLKAQIHSFDTILGTQGLPFVDLIPVIGPILSKGGGEIADFLLPANTIGFIIEKPKDMKKNPDDYWNDGCPYCLFYWNKGCQHPKPDRWEHVNYHRKECDSFKQKHSEDKYFITYFDPESKYRREKTWAFETLGEAKSFQKELSIVWGVTRAEIPIKKIKSNPAKLPSKERYHPGIITTKSGKRFTVKKTTITPTPDMGGNSEFYQKGIIYKHVKDGYLARYMGRGKHNKHTYEIIDPGNTGFKIGEQFTPHEPERYFIVFLPHNMKSHVGLKYPTIPPLVQKYMPPHQQKTVRGHMGEFQDVIERLIKQITDCPSTGQTEGTEDPIAYLHYFYGNADWYIIEKDKEIEQHQAFGYADLGTGFPELGYIGIEELKTTAQIELDFHWAPIPLSQIKEKHEAISNPPTRIDLAANGIRDMFLDRQYSGTVPDKDIQTILTSVRWKRYYGHGNVKKAWNNLIREGYVHKSGNNWVWRINNPLSALAVPITMGVVSGVTAVVASAVMKEYVEKRHRKRKNPKVAIEQYKSFQQMDPKNSDQGGKIADMVSPVTIIGQIKHVVYHCSKWAGEEFENRENENVQYIHAWKRNRMDLCRDGKGDYFISGKCLIEPKGLDDWDKKVDWSDSKIDYPKKAKNYAFLGVLKEVSIVDGDTYAMKNTLLCGRNNHLYIAYVSPDVYEKIKKEYKLK